jgi:hypothetical protein
MTELELIKFKQTLDFGDFISSVVIPSISSAMPEMEDTFNVDDLLYFNEVLDSIGALTFCNSLNGSGGSDELLLKVDDEKISIFNELLQTMLADWQLKIQLLEYADYIVIRSGWIERGIWINNQWFSVDCPVYDRFITTNGKIKKI